MKQQLIILWAFLALAHSAAIDTTISPFEIETDAEEITTFLSGSDIFDQKSIVFVVNSIELIPQTDPSKAAMF